MRMLTLACFSLLSMGCSFIFVRPPPSEPDKLPYFDCVSNGAAPATDVTNVVANGLLALSALDQHETEFAVGVSIAGAVYAASAIYGFIMTSKCGSAKERLAARIHELGREQVLHRAEQRVEQEAPRKARTPERGGCRGDVDCKGERICEGGSCVNPRPAPTPAAPLRSAPPLSFPTPASPTPAAPFPAPASTPPAATP